VNVRQQKGHGLGSRIRSVVSMIHHIGNFIAVIACRPRARTTRARSAAMACLDEGFDVSHRGHRTSTVVVVG